MKNNKKRVLPLLLAGVLLLSAGAYGTRAYFTDSADQNMDIKLTLGNLDIENVDDAGWVYTPEGTGTYAVNNQLRSIKESVSTVIPELASGKILGKDIQLANVRPGDAFRRVIQFTNNGSLDLKVTLATADNELVPTVKSENVNGVYDVVLSDTNATDAQGNLILIPEQTISYTVTISVDGDTVVNDTITDLNDEVLDYMAKALIVEAIQPNAN